MNAADEAIEEIRAVRRRISAAHGHDIVKYLATLRVAEEQHSLQAKMGAELLSRHKENRGPLAPSEEEVLLRERSKP